MVALTKASLWAALSLISLAAHAHSPTWPTIAYSETIQSLRHDVLPRKPSTHQLRLTKRSSGSSGSINNNSTIVLNGDTVRLQLSAFNQTFYLHLEPNHDLVHPDLDLSSHEDLRSVNDIKAFKGVVVQDSKYSRQKWEKAMATTAAEGTGKRTVEHMLHEEGVIGWARMMIEHDEASTMVLRGAFMANSDTYHVTSRQHYHIQKRFDDHTPSASPQSSSELVIYRDSDLYKSNGHLNKRQNEQETGSACGAHKIINHYANSTEHGYYYPPALTSALRPSTADGIFQMGSFGKRDNSLVMVKVASPSPVPTGCPTSRMVNYMGVAADCTYVRSYGGLANARKQIFADFNTASGIYESTFNVALGIVNMEIETMNCPRIPVAGKLWNQQCSTNYTINDRLSDFSFWRGQDNRNKDGAGLWHLMTQCSSGAIVGLAWTKSLCQTNAQSQGSPGQIQYTAGTGVSSISPNEWMVVAHEVGHGFGANHDCTASSCVSAQAISAAVCCPFSNSSCNADDLYIMNPSEQSSSKVFSPCSINSICSTIASSQGSCLQAPSARATQLSSANVCGNGVREAGEQCDCGTPDECANDPCCDGTTCMFKGSAVCDDMNDDCCHKCQLAPKGQVCRSAISECDITETCTGASVACPADVRVPNLTACQIMSGNKTLGYGQCADGVCTSRDYQCAQQQRPGITGQCAASTSGCELLCNDPNGSTDTCIKLPGVNFDDGTPCGSSSTGTCSSGQCVLPGGWVVNHLQIFIPVLCLVIALIGSGIGLSLFCVRRRRGKNAGVKASSVDALASSSPWFGTSRGSGKDSRDKDNSKDLGVMMDVPKWMMSSDRRSSQAMLRRCSQIVLSRRTSMSAQNVLRDSEGDLVAMPSPPAAAHGSPISPRERGEDYSRLHSPYRGVVDEDYAHHQQQLRQQLDQEQHEHNESVHPFATHFHHSQYLDPCEVQHQHGRGRDSDNEQPCFQQQH